MQMYLPIQIIISNGFFLDTKENGLNGSQLTMIKYVNE